MSAPDPATTDNVRFLRAPALVAFAKEALGRQRLHWTIAAITLGRITDERLWERTEYGAAVSEEAWAKDTLGMTRGEVRLALKLWRTMNRHPAVPWTSLAKPRALLLDEALSAGGDVTVWTAKARNAKSTTAFEREVRSQLGEEESFTSLRIRYPESMAELVEEAFTRAAQQALSDEQSPGQGNDAAPGSDGAETSPQAATRDSWRDPAVAFRALEVILVEYIQATVVGPRPEC